MTIAVGDTLPSATFRVMTDEGPAARTTEEVFKGRKVVLFAVPGAFTPTCHKNHLPGYLANYEAIKAKGVDAIAVTGVNDVFVMDAWAEVHGRRRQDRVSRRRQRRFRQGARPCPRRLRLRPRHALAALLDGGR